MLFYKNVMSSEHKRDEMIMKNIIQRNVVPTEEGKTVKLVIYYKSSKTAILVLRNNITTQRSELQQHHVVYRYTCKLRGVDLIPISV